MIFDTEVIVVGAGVAGLAAAAALRRDGKACEVLEANTRIGGRAWTDHPASLGGAAFDHGASWLHAAERNKLAGLARAHGDTLIATDSDWTRHIRVGNRPATAAELAQYDEAWERTYASAALRASAEPDIAFAEALTKLRGNPWTATVETWEACLIAAADPADFSLLDWRQNELTGTNLNVSGGLGALIARRLAGPVHLATPVSHIDWDRPGGGVSVTTPRGPLTARACIVTVSTGVLAAGRLTFAPALPPQQQAAIAALPMGLLTKVALRIGTADRFGLERGTSLHRQVKPGQPAMFFLALPGGADHLIGFVGGPAAWDLSRAGPAATEAFARAEFAGLLGADAAATLGGAVVTTWGEDPAFLGAYAYAKPSHAAARAAMDAPLGPLLFAGEAWCTDGLAGTVGGAFNSGERAAAAAIRIASAA